MHGPNPRQTLLVPLQTRRLFEDHSFGAGLPLLPQLQPISPPSPEDRRRIGILSRFYRRVAVSAGLRRRLRPPRRRKRRRLRPLRRRAGSPPQRAIAVSRRGGEGRRVSGSYRQEQEEEGLFRRRRGSDGDRESVGREGGDAGQEDFRTETESSVPYSVDSSAAERVQHRRQQQQPAFRSRLAPEVRGRPPIHSSPGQFRKRTCLFFFLDFIRMSFLFVYCAFFDLCV